MTLALVLIGISLPALLPPLAHGIGHGTLKSVSGAMALLFRRIVRATFALSAGCTLAIALIQLFTLITRNMFGVNFIAVQESLIYLFGMMFLLGSAGVYLLDGHVRVDVLYSRWSPQRRKWVNIIGTYIFLLPVCGLILFSAAPYVASSWATLERSAEPSGIHAVFLLKSLIPAFAILTIMAAIARLDDLFGERPNAG